MATYLIDHENTKNLTGIDKLNEEDKVVIFYSKNSNSLTFETHKAIMASPAKVDYKYVAVGGKSALDVQLSTYLGYLIKENKTTSNYFVVSGDTCFNYLIGFWKDEKNVHLEILPALNSKPAKKETEVKAPKKEEEKEKEAQKADEKAAQ